MKDPKSISGFSKLSKRGKLKWIVENFFKDPESVMRELMSYWHVNEDQQKLLDGFSENTISNFPMPLGVAPNFLIDGKTYVVPMVIEESSVVAAAASSAKYWMARGGFKSEIVSTTKLGQVYFCWDGPKEKLHELFPEIKEILIAGTRDITSNMESRGGGIIDLKLLDLSEQEDCVYQILASFETCDSMGANFINTCLESFSSSLQAYFLNSEKLKEEERSLEIIMSILSNYTPECLVRVWVECPIDELGKFAGAEDASEFALKFKKAVNIAKIDPYRATTHNKGIFNGIDAVVIATGNDFRAVEAAGHSYAARSGSYAGLSDCVLENGMFRFSLQVPLAIGTVGGLTSLHPMAKRSIEMLGNPSARELMSIIASVGLAQNFAALRSLVTTGIQKGHMKMHLQNILNHLSANEEECKKVSQKFEHEVISHKAVKQYLEEIRG